VGSRIPKVSSIPKIPGGHGRILVLDHLPRGNISFCPALYVHMDQGMRYTIAVRILAVHGLPAARQREEAVHGARPRAFHLNLIAHNLLNNDGHHFSHSVASGPIVHPHSKRVGINQSN